MEWQFKNFEGDGAYQQFSTQDRGRCLDWSNRHLEPFAYHDTISFFVLQDTNKANKNLEFYADVGVNYIFKSATNAGDGKTAFIAFEFIDLQGQKIDKTFLMGIRLDRVSTDNMYLAVRDPENHIKASMHQNGEIAWFSVRDVLNGNLTRSSDSDDYAARALNMEDEKIAKDESGEESKDNNTKDESTEPDIDFTGNGQMEADFFGRGSSNQGNANNTTPDNTTPDNTPDNEVGVNEENSNFESRSAHSSAPSKSVNNNAQDDVKPLTSASNLDLSFKLEEAELDLSNLMQVIEEESNIDLNQLDAINEDIDNLPENLLELTNTIDASDSMSYALADSSSSLEDSHQDSLVAHEPKHKLHS
jgi:hypothetical protein